MNKVFLLLWNILRSIAMIRSIWNSTIHTYFIERAFTFIIGPILKYFYNVDYETHERMAKFRKDYSSLFGRNIFRSGFVNVILHCDEDVDQLEKESPFVF